MTPTIEAPEKTSASHVSSTPFCLNVEPIKKKNKQKIMIISKFLFFEKINLFRTYLFQKSW
jgi:hypothetical protein